MFNVIKNFIAGLIIINLLMFSSCAKDGAVGPQGPQGATGATGPQGPAGSSNNGVSVYNFSTSSSDWSFYGTVGSSDARYLANIYIPSLTTDIYNSGTVLLYYTGGNNAWYSLPQSFYQSSYQYTLTYGYGPGYISILRYDSDLNPVNPGTMNFKAVLIQSIHMVKPNINFSNYEEVKRYYNF